jgi:hypothetical protein
VRNARSGGNRKGQAMTQQRNWLQRAPFKSKRRPREKMADNWLFQHSAFRGDARAVRAHMARLNRNNK